MTLESELAALNRRLNDLKQREEYAQIRVFAKNQDVQYLAN